MTKERFAETSYKMTYEEYLLCDCWLADQAKQKRRGGATYANDRTCR